MLLGTKPLLCCRSLEAAIGTTVQTPSPEPRDDPPSCFSCSDSLAEQVRVPRRGCVVLKHLNPEVTKRSLRVLSQESDHSSDDLSSGVFSSSNSHTDGHIEWLASDNQPSSYCFEGETVSLRYTPLDFWLCLIVNVIHRSDAAGVDIWIENVRGECLRIRERRQVKVGHVAIGISDQVRDTHR